MNTYAVVLTKVPGNQCPVISNGYESVEDLFDLAFNGESIDGYQIQANGRTVDKNYVPVATDSITLAKQIKGN
jgi:hypothetical protein